jgi:hypothetical protein
MSSCTVLHSCHPVTYKILVTVYKFDLFIVVIQYMVYCSIYQIMVIPCGGSGFIRNMVIWYNSHEGLIYPRLSM